MHRDELRYGEYTYINERDVDKADLRIVIGVQLLKQDKDLIIETLKG